jgi:nucleoside-diphosphate-sugar epimerase
MELREVLLVQVLVMGGTRFLGKYVVAGLVKHGYDVTSVNIDPSAAERLPAGVESVLCDRKDHTRLRSALAGRRFEAVLDIVSAPTRPEDVATVLAAVGPDLKRYVFCSSSTVYQKTGRYPITEEHPRDPKPQYGPYTKDKLDCEEFLFGRFRDEGAPICILRPGKIYGPDNYTYREGFHFDRLTRGRPILIPGDGSQLIQFGYVEDVASAFRLAIERDEAIGQAYTATGTEMLTLNTYIDLLMAVTGVRTPTVPFDVRLLERVREPGLFFGEPARWGEGHDCYDISKARTQLGYAPQVSLEEGMRRAFAWYRESGGETYAHRVLDFSFEDELIRLAGEAGG